MVPYRLPDASRNKGAVRINPTRQISQPKVEVNQHILLPAAVGRRQLESRSTAEVAPAPGPSVTGGSVQISGGIEHHAGEGVRPRPDCRQSYTGCSPCIRCLTGSARTRSPHHAHRRSWSCHTCSRRIEHQVLAPRVEPIRYSGKGVKYGFVPISALAIGKTSTGVSAHRLCRRFRDHPVGSYQIERHSGRSPLRRLDRLHRFPRQTRTKY